MSIFDKLTFDARDIKPVSIRISHSTSEVVAEGKVPVGVVFRDDTFETLCEIDESFSFIPFWFVRQLVYMTTKGNHVGGDIGKLDIDKFRVVEHHTDPGHPQFNDNHITFEGKYNAEIDETIFVRDQLTFYVFPFDDKTDSPKTRLIPCQIVFSGANMKTGRGLVSQCHRSRSLKDGAKLCDFVYSIRLTREPVPNKPKNSYYKFSSPTIVNPLPKMKHIKNIEALLEQAAGDTNTFIEQKALRFSAEAPLLVGSEEPDVHRQVQPQPQRQWVSQETLNPPKEARSAYEKPAPPAPAPKKPASQDKTVEAIEQGLVDKKSKVISQGGQMGTYNIELADDDVDKFQLGAPK